VGLRAPDLPVATNLRKGTYKIRECWDNYEITKDTYWKLTLSTWNFVSTIPDVKTRHLSKSWKERKLQQTNYKRQPRSYINHYNVARANSQRWLAGSRVDTTQCQHGSGRRVPDITQLHKILPDLKACMTVVELILLCLKNWKKRYRINRLSTRKQRCATWPEYTSDTSSQLLLKVLMINNKNTIVINNKLLEKILMSRCLFIPRMFVLHANSYVFYFH
jgi:hypothetical protein